MVLLNKQVPATGTGRGPAVSLSIINNVASLIAENSLGVTSGNLQKTLQQLSTGLRINSGADDAAGLSIASGLTSNITALTQSSQNASNAIGFLQSADGALSEVTSLLDRATTLATEASTSGTTSGQSAALDNEYQSILNEITQIGANANFNGSEVFSATAMNPFLGDGTGSSSMLGTPNMSVAPLTLVSLQMGASTTAATSATSTLTLTSVPQANDSVTIGSTTYTFQTAAASGAGQVQIGGSPTLTLQALRAAVNGNSLNGANTAATALASGSAITFTSEAAGAGSSFTAAGSFAGSGSSTGGNMGTWSGGTLSGGYPTSPAQEMISGTPADGDTIAVGGTTYTFVTTLSSGPTVANQILLGGSSDVSFQNLADAINGTGAFGTEYSVGTSADAAVSALGGFNLNLTVASGDNTQLGAVQGAGLFPMVMPGSPASYAGGTLTLPVNPDAGNSIVIGSTTYTFQTGAAVGAGQVQIGGSAGATLQNLASAVNGNSLNTANASAGASASSNTVTFTAKALGGAGDSVAMSGTLTSVTVAGNWTSTGAAGELGGGSDATIGYAYLDTNGAIANGNTVTLGSTTYTFVSALSGVPNEVLIGDYSADGNYGSMANLTSALNGTGTSGVDYSTGTVANTVVGGWFAAGVPSSCELLLRAVMSGPSSGIPVGSTGGALSIAPFSGGSNVVAASGSLSLVNNLAAGATVDIGATSYTFQTGAPAANGQVQLGSTAAATLQNLAAAINGNSGDHSVLASASGSTISFIAATAGYPGDGLAATGTLIATNGSPAGWATASGHDAYNTSSTDLSNTTDAQAALQAVINAISIVSQMRGATGANVNQLAAASNVMNSQIQNLQSADNNVQNADIGKTVSSMAQYSVLQATGMAALQQSNQAQQSLLKLLQ